ncbi:MAG: hypothetical protein PHE25_00880 [Candidatus Gracilibacteria bacterium]|nr:hypothetical protein [Candidatus Gracilibacteria bacterium]
MFSKNKKITYGAKKIDKIVTGFIIGGALASIFGLTHTKKGQEISKELKLKLGEKTSNIFSKGIGLFGKTLAFFASIFSKK